MTKEELAKKLDGKEYRQEISDDIIKEAKASGLVIVYGHSDDLMELEGTISDEGGCYEGEKFLIDKEGLLPDWNNLRAKKLKAVWCAKGEPEWTYKTDIPHATFNVMEDGEVQCRGIVFSIDDL